MKKIILTFSILILSFNLVFADGNRWTSKPPVGSKIDWEHPLTKGLVGVWLMNEGGGLTSKDLIQSNNLTLVSASWVNKGISFNGSSSKATFSSRFTASSSFSFAFKIFPKTTADNNILLTNWDTRSDNIKKSNILITLHSLNRISASSGHTSAGFWSIATSVNDTVTLNQWQTFVVNYNKNGDGLVHIFRNGVEVLYSAQSNGGGGGGYNGAPTEIGGCSSGSYFNGFMEFFMMKKINSGKVFSPSEIKQLHRDPYCFIKSPTIWSKFSTGAVAAVRRIMMMD